ncbi:MAG: polysaccharide deacetylase family protein [Phycisphaerales bacterium]|nr:polysaccharide deacetylase family protein [Phycisphaerales bacterium]
MIALTFDAGSDVGYSHDILDTLAANHIRATFGMTGEWAQANPKFVQRIAREGHTFINHSWSHRSFTGASTGADPLTAEERASELAQTEAHILTLTGVSTKPLFRPPYGDTDDSVARDVAANGYAYQVMWSIDTRGWAGASIEEIVERVREGASDGGIIVMHVGSASEDGPALQAVIDALRAEGYGFATVQGLLGLE